MKDHPELGLYVGRYSMPDYLTFDVSLLDGDLLAVIEGAPALDEIRLSRETGAARPHSFLMTGGPLDGKLVAFDLDADGRPVAAETEGLRLERIADDAETDDVQFLLAPASTWSEHEFEHFGRLAKRYVKNGRGELIAYDADAPRHEFLSYLVEHEDIVLHGSNDANIEEFVPLRRSIDAVASRNEKAVFATPDGIWPIFFAVVNRKIQMGMRNGFTWFGEGGERRKYYHFSISQQALVQRPWVDGTVYLLPKASFAPILEDSGEPANEWISHTAVRPLARLAVSPEDFPFLRQVNGHADDPRWLRFLELQEAFLGSADEIIELDDGYELRFGRSPDREEQIDEFASLATAVLPLASTECGVSAEAGTTWVRMRGLPALKGWMGHQLEQVRREGR